MPNEARKTNIAILLIGMAAGFIVGSFLKDSAPTYHCQHEQDWMKYPPAYSFELKSDTVVISGAFNMRRPIYIPDSVLVWIQNCYFSMTAIDTVRDTVEVHHYHKYGKDSTLSVGGGMEKKK